MATELHDLSIAEFSSLIAARKLSPLELVEALIRRVEQYDRQTHAFITRTFDLARQRAKQAEAEISAGRYRGALHGIPFALKDIYDTKGILTSGHSRVFLDRIPKDDATTTTRLYDAGAVLLGKLATHEMAHAGPSFDLPWPPARNPWNLAHFTGGSSTGSGAAVAAGLVPVALGSDTGGSIRGPASLCGVAGLMPTFGLVSRAGVVTNSYTFDHCGPLGRTVEDCALVLQALAGYDAKDAGSLRRPIPRYREALGQDLRGLRVGVLRHHWEDDIPATEDVKKAMNAALDVLRRLGAELEECRVRPLASYFDVKIIIAESEIFSVHQKNLIARPHDFGADFRSRVLPSVLFSANDYVQATREHRRMMVEMEPLYDRFDAFVMAGMGEAPRLTDYRSVSFWQKPSVFTPWNVTGQPVLGLPNGFGRNGLPLGMQILGRPFGATTGCTTSPPTSSVFRPPGWAIPRRAHQRQERGRPHERPTEPREATAGRRAGGDHPGRHQRPGHDRSARPARRRRDLAGGRARRGRLRRSGQPDPRVRPLGHVLRGPRDGQRLRHDLSHPRPRRPGHRGAARQQSRGSPDGGRGRQVRAAGQAGHVHEPPGLWRERLSQDGQRPELADRPPRGHRGRAEPRRDPQGRSHRRLLRGPERSGDVDGPHRRHGSPRGPADDRRGNRQDRPVRPRGRDPGQFRQRGALHADGCPRDHDQLLPVDPGWREGPDGPRGLRGAGLTRSARSREPGRSRRAACSGYPSRCFKYWATKS